MLSCIYVRREEERNTGFASRVLGLCVNVTGYSVPLIAGGSGWIWIWDTAVMGHASVPGFSDLHKSPFPCFLLLSFQINI